MRGKLVFFSDFDRTLIFSNKFLNEAVESICIEQKKGQPIAYMTSKAFAMLNELRKDVVFIPVSTRTWEGLTRVDFIKENIPEWLICCNGGRIYHQGKLLEEWKEIIENQKRQFPSITELAKNVQAMLQTYGLVESIIYEDSYLVLKFEKMTIEVQAMLEKLHLLYQAMGYRVEINSRKAYVLPDFIRKERAVQFLVEKLNADVSISAGDSIMDVEMLRLTDYAVAPKHKSFEEDFMEVTKHRGLAAGEEILRYVQRIVI